MVEKCLRNVWQNGVYGLTSQKELWVITAEFSIHFSFTITHVYRLLLCKNLTNKWKELKAKQELVYLEYLCKYYIYVFSGTHICLCPFNKKSYNGKGAYSLDIY